MTFFKARRSLLLLRGAVLEAAAAFRFALSVFAEALGALFRDGDRALGGAASVALVVEPPKTADSGTMPMVAASTRLDGPPRDLTSVPALLDFGRPLAAAAQERSVDRLALSAAS